MSERNDDQPKRWKIAAEFLGIGASLLGFNHLFAWWAGMVFRMVIALGLFFLIVGVVALFNPRLVASLDIRFEGRLNVPRWQQVLLVVVSMFFALQLAELLGRAIYGLPFFWFWWLE